MGREVEAFNFVPYSDDSFHWAVGFVEQNADDTAVKSVSDVKKGDVLKLSLSDGDVSAEVKEIKKGQKKTARKGTDNGKE